MYFLFLSGSPFRYSSKGVALVMRSFFRHLISGAFPEEM
ncbi:hypothetical protein SynBIOSU31_01083 [Synechococcus sp. BIOS-U3-1]|nr:hypothetical protein SynBIOSU31_01083 [Synechococcus sp. BIOS-U3-1]